MASLEDMVKKPKVTSFGDGTNGSPVSALPAVAAQNLATASALPSGPVNLSTAPIAPPAPVGGASQIPGSTPYVPVPQPLSTQISDKLNDIGSGVVNRVLPAIGGPAAAMAGEARGFSALGALNRANAVDNVARVAPPGANIPGPAFGVRASGAPIPAPLTSNVNSTSLPGATVTEGANLANVGTPISAAEQATNSAATAARAAQTANAGGAAGTVNPATGLVEGAVPVVQGGNSLSTAQKVMLPTAVAGAVGLPAYVGGAPSGDGANPVTSPIDPATGQPRRTTDNAVAPTLAAKAPGAAVPATNANGAAAPDTPNTTSADRVAQMNRDAASIQDLTSRKLALEQFNGGNGSGVMDQLAPEQAARQKFFDEANLRTAANKGSWSPRGGYKSDDSAIKAAMVPIENRAKQEGIKTQADSHERATASTNAAHLAASNATNAVTLRGQDVKARGDSLRDYLTARGQDVTATGHALTAKAAQDKLDYEKTKDTKEYQRTLAKDGRQAADDQWKIRNETQDRIIEVAARQRPLVDGKPDKDGAARDANAVQERLVSDQKQLEDALKKQPGNEQIKAQLDDFKKFGARMYDEPTINAIIKGNQATELANTAQGRAVIDRLWQGTQGSQSSTVPFEGVKRVSRPYPLPDIYVETDRNGNVIKQDNGEYRRTIPAALVEGDQGVLGTGFLKKNGSNLSNITHR